MIDVFDDPSDQPGDEEHLEDDHTDDDDSGDDDQVDLDELINGWVDQMLSVQNSLGERWVSLAKVGAVLATIAMGLALLALALSH